jgi:hypothetical protein
MLSPTWTAQCDVTLPVDSPRCNPSTTAFTDCARLKFRSFKKGRNFCAVSHTHAHRFIASLADSSLRAFPQHTLSPTSSSRHKQPMSPSELPGDVRIAIASGDVARLQHLYGSNLSLEEVAKQAARDKQPQVLEWCYTQGWKHPEESFNNDFFITAVDGGIPIFQVLLDHGWKINAHHSEACGDALNCAVTSGDYDFAKWLLDHGHDATPSEGIHGPNVLSTTVQGDTTSMEMLKLLIDHGISLEDCGAGVAAAEEGNLEALQLLIDHGINLEDRDRSWGTYDEDDEEDSHDAWDSCATALYRACKRGELDCIELLLDRGADAQAKNDEGLSCYSVAKKRGHQDVVKLLEEKGVTE